jgi:hypothetical protein
VPIVKATRPANTIPMAAKKLGLPEKMTRDAVKRGEIRSVMFAGLPRVTDAEIERVRDMLGLPLPPEIDIEHAREMLDRVNPKGRCECGGKKRTARRVAAERAGELGIGEE